MWKWCAHIIGARGDLAAGEGLPGTGIHSVGANGGPFETARAARVGITVAQDVRASRRSAD